MWCVALFSRLEVYLNDENIVIQCVCTGNSGMVIKMCVRFVNLQCSPPKPIYHKESRLAGIKYCICLKRKLRPEYSYGLDLIVTRKIYLEHTRTHTCIGVMANLTNFLFPYKFTVLNYEFRNTLSEI